MMTPLTEREVSSDDIYPGLLRKKAAKKLRNSKTKNKSWDDAHKQFNMKAV